MRKPNTIMLTGNKKGLASTRRENTRAKITTRTRGATAHIESGPRVSPFVPRRTPNVVRGAKGPRHAASTPR